MKSYRIFTENKNKTEVIQLTGAIFDGFTIVEALGYWQGKAEDSLIIEVVTEHSDLVDALAKAILVANEQQAVLIVDGSGDGRLINA